MIQYAWAGTKKQLENYLHIVGAECNNDGDVLLFGDVAPYPGADNSDKYILVSPGTIYFRKGELRNLTDDLLRSNYGYQVLHFRLHLESDYDFLTVIPD